ncbi:MAG TPA: asparagine synthase-related protein [Trebonia sp.]
MYFTLAISAASAESCAALTEQALATGVGVMPIPGPASVSWRSADGRAVLLRWGADANAPAEANASSTQIGHASHNGTIWVDLPATESPVCARTSLTRVDPVYAAELPGAVIVSDRAMWAASVADRLGDLDPSHACALLNTGFPLGATTPWRGVSALPPAATARAASGRLTVQSGSLTAPASGSAGSAAAVAAALVAAVEPLKEAGEPVQLSLTGGKDSRLVAAALVSAGVAVHAKTHGFPEHPDVIVAADVAKRLGLDHTPVTPAAPGQDTDVLARLRATVLVADGMLSAFENVGRTDPSRSPALSAGGHGGELLRGGYAETAAGRRAASLRAAEVLRRLTTKHLGLIRRGPAAGYVTSLAPWTGTALARGPLPMLDDFYLVNRAGRWSAAARQAYLIRERLVQPLFDEQVVRSARVVPLGSRTNGSLIRDAIAELRPDLAGVPFAGKPAKGAVPPTFDWRREYGAEIAEFFRDYTLDLGAKGGLFDVVSRAAAEKILTPPHADRGTVWALATLACLYSGDYRDAREPVPRLPVT